MIPAPAHELVLKGYARRIQEGMPTSVALDDLAKGTGFDPEWLALFIDEGPYDWREYEQSRS